MKTPRLVVTALAATVAMALSACGSGGSSTTDTTPAATGAAGGTTAASSAPAPAEFEALDRLQIIAPANPGSGWDQTSRAVQEALKNGDLAKTVEVQNVPGASGTVALAQIAPQKGKKDLWITSGLAMMSGIISNGTEVNLDNLTPLARLVGEYEVIVAPAGSPYKNVDDLFAAIKANPKSVAIAGGSAGSADHIYIGLLAQHYGVNPADVNYVPYSGGGEATTALLGNKVQAGIAGLNEFSEQIKNGKMVGLLVSSLKDIDGVTFAQNASAIDAKLEFQNWRSMMAPADIDEALTAQYIEALTKMHDSDGWKATLTKNAWDDNFIAGDEFASWLKEENTRVQGVLSDLGLAKK